jgi:hypothetical protein
VMQEKTTASVLGKLIQVTLLVVEKFKEHNSISEGRTR